MLRADLTPTAPEAGLVQRLAVTAAQAPTPATEGRAFALRSGLGAVLAAGVTVVAGVGVSYAAGVVDAPWAPPADAPPAHVPRHTTSPDEPAATRPGHATRTTTTSPAPGSTPSGRATRGTAIASERSHGRRGDEKGGPHRPAATPAPGKLNGPAHRRTDAPGRTGVKPTPDAVHGDRVQDRVSPRPAPQPSRTRNPAPHGSARR